MADVILARDARADFREALRWYAEHDAAAAERFQAAFDAVIDTLARFPEIGPRVDGRHRYFALRKFSYGVVYRVLVVGVPHDRQMPKDWGKRT